MFCSECAAAQGFRALVAMRMGASSLPERRDEKLQPLSDPADWIDMADYQDWSDSVICEATPMTA
jgi:hypothetical protein